MSMYGVIHTSTSQVKISDGCKVLGGVIGTENAEKTFKKISKTAEIAVKRGGRS